MSFSFQVITLFPEMIQSAMAAGVFGQAQKKELLKLSTINPREFTSDIHKTVDDRPFGGGDGMIMMAEPLAKSIAKAKIENLAAPVFYLSPQGKPFTQAKAAELAQLPGMILVCGRYGGIDQRVIHQLVDEEISVGDYVISGGELAAGIVMDAVSRLIPGVLGHADSAENDSFAKGLLEHPNFTKPRDYSGFAVPEVLLGGNHKKIQEWKQILSLLVTLAKRPDLLQKSSMSKELSLAKKFWQSLLPEEKQNLGLVDLQEADFHE
ncbi:MAG: tRNA (guanosine(37)-N1)-methyltransferase TrmD [Bdellovibrionaceae bacterium]|nr:tRNA (guanosine(37)-N1)-methyltransferase TrmD [Pseudobdellovibrionaceae bacterium]